MGMRVFCDIETLSLEKAALSNFPKVCDCGGEDYRRLALTGEYGRVLTIGVIVEVDGRVTQAGLPGTRPRDEVISPAREAHAPSLVETDQTLQAGAGPYYHFQRHLLRPAVSL